MALPSENMNLNLYRVFYIVAKTKSFSESTKTLHISQPAISKHIQNLEYELNTVLFCRTNRGIELTAEAKALLPYVEKAYNYLMLGERELKEGKEMEKATISLGIPSYINTYYIKEKIKTYMLNNPNTTIKLKDNSKNYLIESLLQHNIDLAIISNNSVNNKNIKEINIYNDRYCFAAHSTYPNIANFTSLNEILNDKVIVPVDTKEERQALERYLTVKNLKMVPTIEADTIDMILNYTKDGMGIGYLPLEVVKQNNDLKEIEITDKLPEIKISILYDEESLTSSSESLLQELTKKEDEESENQNISNNQ